MTPKRTLSVVLVFLSIALASAQSSGIVPATGPWLHLVAWAGSMIAAALALLPALFGDAPVTLPQGAVAEVAKKAGVGVVLLLALGASGCDSVHALGGVTIAAFVSLVAYIVLHTYARIAGLAVLLFFLAGTAHAQGIGAGLAQGVVTSGTPPAADPGVLQIDAELLPASGITTSSGNYYLLADATVDPAVSAVVQPVTADPPAVATNPTLPIVPPSCIECAKQIGDKIPVTSKWSGWYTAAILVGSGIVFTLDQLHAFGVIK